MNMTLIDIVKDTDLPPSKKDQLIEAIKELERLKLSNSHNLNDKSPNEVVIKDELNRNNFYMMKYPIIESILKSDMSRSDKGKLKEAVIELERLKTTLKGFERKDKYLKFIEDKSKNLKTRVFDVYNIFGENLGHIRWDFVYQSYSYHAGGVFDPGCLFEAIVKLNELNEERRVKLQ